MGRELNRRDERAVSKRKNPLAVIPAELRADVSRLLVCRAAIIKDPLALCAQFQVWLQYFGLEPEDLRRICLRMLSPHVVADEHFESEITADVARLVVDVTRKRKLQREAEVRKQAEAEADGKPGVSTALVKVLDAMQDGAPPDPRKRKPQ